MVLSMYQWFSNDLNHILDIVITHLWYESATVQREKKKKASFWENLSHFQISETSGNLEKDFSII